MDELVADTLPSAAALRRLWARMAAIFGTRWTCAYGDACEHDDGTLTTAGDSWQRGLAGVTARQMAAGISSALVSANPWPPTLPEFRALCFGIPTLERVRLDLRQKRVTGFGRMVWAYLDPHEYRIAAAPQQARIVAEAYALAREDVMGGTPIPAASDIALPPVAAPPHQPASDETASRELAEMRRIVSSHVAHDEALPPGDDA